MSTTKLPLVEALGVKVYTAVTSDQLGRFDRGDVIVHAADLERILEHLVRDGKLKLPVRDTAESLLQELVKHATDAGDLDVIHANIISVARRARKLLEKERG